jgi:hypothetical protein
MAMSYDADAFALPIAFSLVVLLCYAMDGEFESADIAEDANSSFALSTLFDVFCIAAGATPLLVALFNGGSSKEEADEQLEEEDEEEAAEEQRNGHRKQFPWREITFDCYSELFNNVMGYIMGLTFFIMTQAYFLTDLSIALGLPSDTVNFTASLLLALAMSYLLPGIFATINVQNVVRDKKNAIRQEQMSFAHDDDNKREGSAPMNNMCSQMQTNPGSSISEQLLTEEEVSKRRNAQLAGDGDDELFNCQKCGYRFAQQFARHRRALILAACQLVVGWTWEETLIGVLNLLFTDFTTVIVFDILVTLLIILVAARVQAYLDATAENRARRIAEVRERLAMKRLTGERPRYSGLLSFLFYYSKKLTFSVILLFRPNKKDVGGAGH